MASQLPRLYVQCNPLLDISAAVPDSFFEKYKIEKGSAALVTEEQASIYSELEQQPDVVYIPGGSGLNTARVAQWVSQADKGDFVSFVGCAANDEYGNKLKAAAEAEGVCMELEYTTKAPTGSCAVCISNKERSLVANLAAANCLSPEFMHSEQVSAALKRSKLFYATSFVLTVGTDHVLQVAEAARAAEGTFILNLSAPFLIQVYLEELKRVLPYVDILCGNETEVSLLAKVLDMTDSSEDLLSVAQVLANKLPYTGSRDRLVIVTHGCEPTVYASRGGSSGAVEVKKIPEELIVDTNTCGDAFVGGFLAALACGRDVRRCCEVGNYAAGVIIQHDGCTYPPRPDIQI